MCGFFPQVLQEKLDTAVGLEVGLRNKLEKAREENEELRFQASESIKNATII